MAEDIFIFNDLGKLTGRWWRPLAVSGGDLVPGRGLEPPRCYPLVPETSASTNSATRAGEEGGEMYARVRGLSIEGA
jgi:hypothetical protein